MNAIKLSEITVLLFLALGGSASGTLLLYDGFLAGGSSPNSAAGEYETGTGYSNDEVIGQNPTIANTSGEWKNDSSSYADSVYYRTEDVQMGYTDSGGNSLITSGGQLNLERTSGTSGTDKNVYRDISIGNFLPTDLYISMLVRMTANESFTFRSASTDGSETRRFNFGINENRNPFVTNTEDGGSSLKNTGTVEAATGETHLLVIRLHDAGTSGDTTTFYLDPILSSEGVNTSAAELAYGNAYVGGTAAWTLKDIYFQSVVEDTGSSIEIDEIRMGSTWEDVTPHVIPEPSSLVLLTLALGLFGIAFRKM